MKKWIDLRSDTVTLPTPEMRKAMAEAEVGDDVYREDPTVTLLEETVAAKVGKEAGLFVTSGTQGNLVALLAHCNSRGMEVIVEAEAHIFYYEVGGLSALGGLVARRVPGENGVLTPEDVAHNIRGENIHYPVTGLVCIENTHNRAGGMVWTSEQTEAVAAVAHKHGVPVHLDGARVFNAAVAQNIDVRELTYPVDSVNVCLSKGLAAPVGSVLCGSLPFIERARKYRKMVGGGMRQAGIIAAAGLVAINAMVDRLAEDHANARKLAEELANIPKLKVDLSKVQTNMVVLDVSGTGMNGEAFSLAMLEQGVKVNANSEYAMRFVTNHDVSNEDINTVLAAVKRVVGA